MEKRLALLMGNSEYAHAHSLMGSPIENVKALGAKLRALGFEVIEGTDCTLSCMQMLEDEFLYKIIERDVGLFYFAGHGMEHNGVTYLLPSDDREWAAPQDEPGIERWLRQTRFSFNQRHEAYINRESDRKTKVHIAILDCCRRDPMPSPRSELTPPHGAFYAFAASPNQYAWYRQGRMSFYTEHLVRWIDAPGLTLEEMFRNVRRDVAAHEIHAQGEVYTQIGWDHSSLIGDFCLNPAPGRSEKARMAYCPHCGAAVTQADGDTCPFCRRTL